MTGGHRAGPIGLSIYLDRNANRGTGRGIMFADARLMDKDAVVAMATHARGLVSAALSIERAFALDLIPLPTRGERWDRPCFFANVESVACTETGISAAERATTLAALGSWSASAADFKCPGHIAVAIVRCDRERLVSGPLNEVAFCHASTETGALAIGWCDILAAGGDIADTQDCLALADKLNLPVVERVPDRLQAATCIG